MNLDEIYRKGASDHAHSEWAMWAAAPGRFDQPWHNDPRSYEARMHDAGLAAVAKAVRDSMNGERS